MKILNALCQLRLLPKISVVVMTVLLISVTACGRVTFKDSGFKLENNIAAWGDFNDDGYTDICDGNSLRKNNAGEDFNKIEIAKTGESVWADFDNDGDLDLFSWPQLKLFRNVKNGSKFDEVNVRQFLPPLPDPFPTEGACCGDFNKDGYVDIYIGGFRGHDFKLTNLKGQSFKIQQLKSSLFSAPFCTRGVTACDFDEDADIDIYVSNYFQMPNNYQQKPNLLWLNNGAGTFNEAAACYGIAGDPNVGMGYGHTIGSAWGDLDNDGHFDLFVGNLNHPDQRRAEDSKFYKNEGPSGKWHFQDKSATAGLAWKESYASPALGDYDNDGDLDLFLTAISPDHAVLYRNNGNWDFNDVTSDEGLGGLSTSDNRQAAWADFDNDGDLDLVTAGKLFVNQGNGNNWLKVRLQGDGKKVNRSAIGAQVRIKLEDRTLTRQVEAGTGEGNQNDLTLHFGLGTHDKPVNLEIFWPNGTRQEVKEVEPNQLKKVYFDETK